MKAASFETQNEGNQWLLQISGDWTLSGDLSLLDEKLRKFSDKIMGAPLKIDLTELEDLDTAGAMMLQRTMRCCASREREGEKPLSNFENVEPQYEGLLTEAVQHLLPCEIEEPPKNAFAEVLVRLGKGGAATGKDVLQVLGFLGQIIAGIGRLVKNPRKFRLTATVHHMEETGLNATMIVGLMSFLIGAVIAFMGIKILRQFGAEILTVEMIGITVLREFGVLLTAILIAGRSGSAFTASLGSMKLREEIDAMTAMGIDPLEALVIPRTIAMVFILPALAFVAAMMGLIGGGLVAWWAADISPNLFMARMQDVIVLQNFFVGLVKAPFFAFFISIIGCYQGMSVHGSSEELGRRTTISVVQSLFIVIFLDALFAIFFLELGV